MNTTQSQYMGPRILALYGSPVQHSLSPIMFNAAFSKLRLNKEYRAITVRPDQLPQAVEMARKLRFEGFNVTMPLKRQIIPLLERIEGDAKAAGAVNTVAVRSKQLVGYNTDGEGFLLALRVYRFESSGCRVLVLGAGGAARAIITVLSRSASDIVILNRSVEKAKEATEAVAGRAHVSCEHLDRNTFLRALEQADLIVNATPLGTDTLLETNSISRNSIPNRLLICDLAYQNGQSMPGKNTISPIELLLQQALLSYRIWMDTAPPYETMRLSLVNHLGYDWRNRSV